MSDVWALPRQLGRLSRSDTWASQKGCEVAPMLYFEWVGFGGLSPEMGSIKCWQRICGSTDVAWRLAVQVFIRWSLCSSNTYHIKKVSIGLPLQPNSHTNSYKKVNSSITTYITRLFTNDPVIHLPNWLVAFCAFNIFSKPRRLQHNWIKFDQLQR